MKISEKVLKVESSFEKGFPVLFFFFYLYEMVSVCQRFPRANLKGPKHSKLNCAI
jgi:hypothetical protein